MDDQQLCVVWAKASLVGVSLSGYLNILDLENGSVSKILKGHNKPITSLAISAEKSLAFTADFEGNISKFSPFNGLMKFPSFAEHCSIQFVVSAATDIMLIKLNTFHYVDSSNQ